MDLIRRASPRQAIILTYWDWVRWNKDHGLRRRESQTPNEYAADLERRWPEISEQLDKFTEQFILARYSRQTVDHTQADEAQTRLTALKKMVLKQELNAQVE